MFHNNTDLSQKGGPPKGGCKFILLFMETTKNPPEQNNIDPVSTNENHFDISKKQKIVLSVLGGIICMAAGGMLTIAMMDKSTVASKKDVAELQNMKNLISTYGLYSIDEDNMREGMLKGAIEGFANEDPYAVYYPAEHNNSIDENADIHAESYKGIGAMVNVNNEGSLTVQQVFNDSGAADAGIKEGDKITSINGTNVTEDNANTLLQDIKNSKEETVSANVVSTSDDGTNTDVEKEVIIQKKDVVSPKVTHNVTETVTNADDEKATSDIGYIAISDFSGNVVDQFKETVDKLTENHDLKGIIIDLRNNGGGEIENACEMLDYILPDDITTFDKNIKQEKNKGHTFLTRVESKHEDDKEWVCTDGHEISKDIPITVIVNEYTASAAEILSGVLQMYDRATIVGNTTFGKGIVQSVFSFSDGSSVQFTSGQWFLPDMTNIQKKGITPDIISEADENNVRDELADAYKTFEK